MAEAEQDTVEVRFLVDQLYESEGRGRGPLFKAGKVYEMPPEHAQRWVGRNVAELVEPPPDPFPEVENAKPRRGRPPKDRSADEGADDGKSEPAEAGAAKPPQPAPLGQPTPSAPTPANQPAKAPDKVR